MSAGGHVTQTGTHKDVGTNLVGRGSHFGEKERGTNRHEDSTQKE